MHPIRKGKLKKSENQKGDSQSTLTLQSLLFSISLLFSFSDFLAFLCVFPPSSKDFRGSAKRKTLAFFGGFPCFFQKSKGWRVRDQGVFIEKGLFFTAKGLTKGRGGGGSLKSQEGGGFLSPSLSLSLSLLGDLLLLEFSITTSPPPPLRGPTYREKKAPFR